MRHDARRFRLLDDNVGKRKLREGRLGGEREGAETNAKQEPLGPRARQPVLAPLLPELLSRRGHRSYPFRSRGLEPLT